MCSVFCLREELILSVVPTHTYAHTHLCSSDHSSTSPHRRHRVCCRSVPCKQMDTQILYTFSSKPIMTHSPLFSQTGTFLGVLVVNAKLAELSSSLHMQSASCLMFELEMHKTMPLIYMKPGKLGHNNAGSHQKSIKYL